MIVGHETHGPDFDFVLFCRDSISLLLASAIRFRPIEVLVRTASTLGFSSKHELGRPAAVTGGATTTRGNAWNSAVASICGPA